MSKFEKQIKRLQNKPKVFTYDELEYILNKLGFFEYNKGKTSGSRVVFINKKNLKIELHKPHPDNNLKYYQINILLKKLKEWEVI